VKSVRFPHAVPRSPGAAQGERASDGDRPWRRSALLAGEAIDSDPTPPHGIRRPDLGEREWSDEGRVMGVGGLICCVVVVVVAAVVILGTSWLP
jgi:hypothetical protein